MLYYILFIKNISKQNFVIKCNKIWKNDENLKIMRIVNLLYLHI